MDRKTRNVALVGGAVALVAIAALGYAAAQADDTTNNSTTNGTAGLPASGATHDCPLRHAGSGSAAPAPTAPSAA